MTSRIEHPVSLTGRLEPGLSRGLWLVKWLLVLPHLVVLLFLWAAVVVLTVVAWFAILFTARYPRSIFDFNVGVMRWTWRVQFYAYGALGTDRYPPFTIGDVPDYPARLDVAYPGRLSRGLVLVKTWLLAIPHYLVLGFFLGAGTGWDLSEGPPAWPWSVGLVGLLVLVAGVVLLFTAAYPRPVFDLVLGMDRWAARVAAYALLMTDHYPPFRLDQGGEEPGDPTPPPHAPDHHAVAAEPVAPVAPVAPTRWTSFRIVAVAVGSVLLTGALGSGLAGGGLLLADRELRDDDGFLTTRAEALSTPTYAVVSQNVHLDGGSLTHAMLGEIKVTARSSGAPVFLGVAPTDAVQDYLRDVAHAVLVEVRDGTPVYREEPGEEPAVPPSDAVPWTATATGAGTRTIRWDAADGDWTAVLMNVNGSAQVSAEVSAGATLPVVGWGAVTLLAIGLVLLVVGLVIVMAALPRPPSATATGAPTPVPPDLSGAVR